MTYDDTAGLDLFDEAASAVGNFPQALRGYDKGAVDAYVRDVEAQLSRAKAQIRQQQKQLAAAAAAKAEDTDFSRLGGHTRGMLRTAEAQADELVTSAQTKAREILAAAEAEAQRRLEEAAINAENSQAKSAEAFAELRRQLSEQNAADLAGVKDQASMIRDAAQREAEQLLAEAQQQAQIIAERNTAECEAKLAEAERHYAEQQVALAEQRQADLASLQLAQEEAATKLDELVAAARQQAESFQIKVEADSQTWDQRREAVIAEAEQTRLAAEAQAEAILAAARAEAASLQAEAVRLAEDKKAKIETSVELLSGRQKAILAQLNELSALAGMSVIQFGEPNTEASPADSASADDQTAPASDAADDDSVTPAQPEPGVEADDAADDGDAEQTVLLNDASKSAE